MSVLNLTEEQLKKYYMNTLEQFQKDFGQSIHTEIGYYETFLIRTDYIVTRAAEASLLNEPNDIENYAEVMAARKTSRNRINELQEELANINS